MFCFFVVLDVVSNIVLVLILIDVGLDIVPLIVSVSIVIIFIPALVDDTAVVLVIAVSIFLVVPLIRILFVTVITFMISSLLVLSLLFLCD